MTDLEPFDSILDRTIKACARKVEARLQAELFDLLQKEKANIIAATQEGSHLPDNYWHERHAVFVQLKRLRETFL